MHARKRWVGYLVMGPMGEVMSSLFRSWSHRIQYVLQGFGASPPLVGQQYVVQGHQPTVLVLKEKSISMGTDSEVMNQQGQVISVL